jgi:hypothetical protein
MYQSCHGAESRLTPALRQTQDEPRFARPGAHADTANCRVRTMDPGLRRDDAQEVDGLVSTSLECIVSLSELP